MEKASVENTSLAQQIEQRIERETGLSVIVEAQGDRIILSGRVDTPEAKQAAGDIAGTMLRGKQLDNDLEVEQVSPVETSGFYTGAAQSVTLPDSVQEIRAADAQLDPDFAGRVSDDSSLMSAGVDPDEESDTAYEPPTDPVITTDRNDNVQVLGGFSHSSMDSIEVERSSDGTIGDEAIAEAVLRELREDAATTAFEIDVAVARGVVRLRGRVSDVADAENVEEVAARVPGVIEVVEELTVEAA